MMNEGMIPMLVALLSSQKESLVSKALEMLKFFDRTRSGSLFIIIQGSLTPVREVPGRHGEVGASHEALGIDKLGPRGELPYHLQVPHRCLLPPRAPQGGHLQASSSSLDLDLLDSEPFQGIIKKILEMLHETKNVQVQQRSLQLIASYQGLNENCYKDII